MKRSEYQKPEDNIGKKFNYLTILQIFREQSKFNKKVFNVFAFCKCDCGQKHFADYQCVRRGTIKSCGCDLRFGEPDKCMIAKFY